MKKGRQTEQEWVLSKWISLKCCGRIADNLREFFEFVVNCPYWQDYLDEDEYQDREELREFVFVILSVSLALELSSLSGASR